MVGLYLDELSKSSETHRRRKKKVGCWGPGEEKERISVPGAQRVTTQDETAQERLNVQRCTSLQHTVNDAVPHLHSFRG